MQRKTELEEAWEALKEKTQERSITLSDSVEVHQVGRLWVGKAVGGAVVYCGSDCQSSFGSSSTCVFIGPASLHAIPSPLHSSPHSHTSH